MEVLPITNQYNVGFNSDKAWKNQWTNNADPSSAAERALAARLERELRAAKSASALSGAEVLVPSELLSRAARAVLAAAADEPCGARGTALRVVVGDRMLTAFQLDPHTVPTHELTLNLQHSTATWTNILPQFLKNLTRGGTIIISPQFTLNKKKLFRSSE